jgi:hypothetical protein
METKGMNMQAAVGTKKWLLNHITLDQNDSSRRPSTQVMVDTAILLLNNCHGSSTVAIKKFIIAYYPVKSKIWLQRCVRRYLDQAILEMHIVRRKHSYKLSPKVIYHKSREIMLQFLKKQRKSERMCIEAERRVRGIARCQRNLRNAGKSYTVGKQQTGATKSVAGNTYIVRKQQTAARKKTTVDEESWREKWANAQICDPVSHVTDSEQFWKSDPLFVSTPMPKNH